MILALQSCCVGKKKNPSEDLRTGHNAFLGKWHSVERAYPFEAILTIDSAGGFAYEGGASVLHFTSRGGWVLKNDTLVLENKDPEECCYIMDFDVDCVEIASDNSTDNTSWETSQKGCFPESPDTYIIFAKELFILRDSILMHIQKNNKLCPEIRNDFTRH